MGSMQIGWYVVPQTRTFRKQYEVAAWYTEIEVEAGQYPLVARIEHGKVIDWPGPAASLPGVIVEQYMPSLFAGNHIAGTDPFNRDEVGKLDNHTVRPYAHSVAWSILQAQHEGTPTPFLLAPGVCVRLSAHSFGGGKHEAVTAGLWVESATPQQMALHLGATQGKYSDDARLGTEDLGTALKLIGLDSRDRDEWNLVVESYMLAFRVGRQERNAKCRIR